MFLKTNQIFVQFYSSSKEEMLKAVYRGVAFLNSFILDCWRHAFDNISSTNIKQNQPKFTNLFFVGFSMFSSLIINHKMIKVLHEYITISAMIISIPHQCYQHYTRFKIVGLDMSTLNLQSLIDKVCGLKKVNYRIIQNDRVWCSCRSVYQLIYSIYLYVKSLNMVGILPTISINY